MTLNDRVEVLLRTLVLQNHHIIQQLAVSAALLAEKSESSEEDIAMVVAIREAESNLVAATMALFLTDSEATRAAYESAVARELDRKPIGFENK